MGWTYYNLQNTTATGIKDEIKNNIISRDYKVVAECLKNGAYYAALKDESGEVSAVVCLYRIVKDYFNFGYKIMSEFEGPYCYGAPVKILEALTPTEDEHANKWRASCYEEIERTKTQAKIKKALEKHDYIILEIKQEDWRYYNKGEIINLVKHFRKGRSIWVDEARRIKWNTKALAEETIFIYEDGEQWQLN